MANLKFNIDQVRKLVEHTTTTKGGHSPAYRLSDKDPITADPGLLLVKDDGIYLMSNAKEKLPGEDGKMNFVAYAIGYEPDAEDSWSKCRDAVGGDDFAELLPIEMFSSELDTDDNTITVSITARQICVKATARRVKPLTDPAAALENFLANYEGKIIVFGAKNGKRKPELVLYDARKGNYPFNKPFLLMTPSIVI